MMMEKKRNVFWIEENNVAGCECCAWYTYQVCGFDDEGNFVEYGPYTDRGEADDKVTELEGTK